MSEGNGFRERFLDYKRELEILVNTQLKVHSAEKYMKFTSREKVSDNPHYPYVELRIFEKQDGYVVTFTLPHQFSSRKAFEEAIRALKERCVHSKTGKFADDHGGILQDYRFQSLDFFVARDFLDNLFVFNLVESGKDSEKVLETMKQNIGILVEFYGLVKQ